MRALLCLVCTWLMLVPALALGDRAPAIRFSGHVEGQEMETERFVLEHDSPAGPRWFRRAPEFTQEDIADYRLVETARGSAVALLLDDTGRRRLENLSLERQGRGEYLLLAINGQPREFQRIDRPIEDGIVMLWAGLAPDELEDLEEQVRRNRR